MSGQIRNPLIKIALNLSRESKCRTVYKRTYLNCFKLYPTVSYNIFKVCLFFMKTQICLFLFFFLEFKNMKHMKGTIINTY